MSLSVLSWSSCAVVVDCLAKLNVVVENINTICITIVGYFNANLSQQSMFGDILQNVCNGSYFGIVDKDILPADTNTYVSSA